MKANEGLMPVSEFLERYNEIQDDRYEVINAINKVKGCPDYEVTLQWLEAVKKDNRSSVVVLYNKYLELDAKKRAIEQALIEVPQGLFRER